MTSSRVALCRPDWSTTSVHPTLITLHQGTRLVRIFDAFDASLKRYSQDSYNPTPIHPDRRYRRGRFSGTLKDPFSYLYAAEQILDERVSILELIEYKGVAWDAGAGVFLITATEVEGLAFAYLDVTMDINLVSLCSEPEVVGVGADRVTLDSSHYRVTREWARYIRRVVPNAMGLAYIPHRYGNTESGRALVLWGDRVPAGALASVGPPVMLASPEGRQVFLRCMAGTRCAPGW